MRRPSRNDLAIQTLQQLGGARGIRFLREKLVPKTSTSTGAIYAGGIHVREGEMSRLLNFLACVKVLTRSLDSREFREFMETVADGIKPRVIIIYSPEAKSLASMAKSWTRPSSKHSETRVSTSRN
jgi:hypothetical protein